MATRSISFNAPGPGWVQISPVVSPFGPPRVTELPDAASTSFAASGSVTLSWDDEGWDAWNAEGAVTGGTVERSDAVTASAVEQLLSASTAEASSVPNSGSSFSPRQSGGSIGSLGALPLPAGRVIPTVAFVGDSWSTESTMGVGFNLPAAAARLLGCAPVVSAVDGSGFAYSASGNENFEADARIAAICGASPDLIVTVGSLNADKVIDNGDATGGKITAAVKKFVSAIRDKCPRTPIIMVGPEPSSVARLISSSAHINARAQKAGVAEAGGADNGVLFIDWLGVADKQAVPWRDGRVCATGDIVVHNGVAYRITRPWAPASGETPATPGAPAVQVSDVLSGTGRKGSPKGDGTRDTLLLSDDTHPTAIGGIAFGAALAKHVTEGLDALRPWLAKQSVAPAPQPEQPPVPKPPSGDGLPTMAWLSGGWGDPNRVAYSAADLNAVAALKPEQVALPLRGVADTADLAVGIPDSFTGNDNVKREFSNVTIRGAKSLGLDVAGLVESLNMLEAAGIEVLPNVRNGLADSSAEYYKSSDGKCFTVLASRGGKTYQEIHGRGQTKLRGIMKTQYPTITRVVDATDATADWMLTDPIKDAQRGILSASKAGAGVWGAVNRVFPDGVWVLVASKDEQEIARAAAKTAGVTIVGWAVPTAEALAAIRA